MLKIAIKQTDDNKWEARATLSGRCIRKEAAEPEIGRTKGEAVKKLKTKLLRESDLLVNAMYRVGACIQQSSSILENEFLCEPEERSNAGQN